MTENKKAGFALHWQILIAMIVGAAVGLGLNFQSGDFRTEEPVAVRSGELQRYGMTAPIAVSDGELWSHDRPERILLQIREDREGYPSRWRRAVVGLLGEGRTVADLAWPDLPAGIDPSSVDTLEVPSLDDLQRRDPGAWALFKRHARSTARSVGDFGKQLGDLFLRLLKMVSVPLIIFSLLTGILGLGDADRLGRMFTRTIAYYLTTSMLAICTGLLMFNLIQPGASEQTTSTAAAPTEQGKSLITVLFEQVENMIPPNPVNAITEGRFLGIIAFTIAFGIFAILIGGAVKESIGSISKACFQVMMRMTSAIIKLAPAGVLCLMLFATATQGIAIFGTLGIYMVTVAAALALHALVILPLILKFFAKRNPVEYARAMAPALLTAFSSASSNATLPLTLTCVEQRAGVSNRTGSFVLPLGATVNMDGTALYEAIAVLFIANLTPGVELGFADQVIVAFTALLASIGAAGIPHAGLVMMVIILQAVGLPTEQQGLIIAVDRVLDMCRTSVNVWSDSCGCAVIDRFDQSD